VLLHFEREGQAFGPYPLEEAREYLKRGQILPTDLAWYEGGPGWIPVLQVPGMIGQATVAAASSPPPPSSSAQVVARYVKGETKFNKHFFMSTLGTYLKSNPDVNPEQLFMRTRTGEEYLLYRVAKVEQDHCIIQMNLDGVRKDKRVDYFNINEIEVRPR